MEGIKEKDEMIRLTSKYGGTSMDGGVIRREVDSESRRTGRRFRWAEPSPFGNTAGVIVFRDGSLLRQCPES